MSNLTVIVRPQFDNNRELPSFSSSSITDMELHDTVIGYTANILTSGVSRTFQTAIHRCGFSCHNRPPSNTAIDAPFITSPHDSLIVNLRNKAEKYVFYQSLHGVYILPENMAKGWRRFLEEESEHQWLAISLFFVFIIIGAFAIHGTSKLTGMDLENNYALENSRVLEISYQDDGEYHSVSHTNDGTYLYHFADGERTDIINPNTDPSASGIQFITQLDNGTVATSIEENSIMIIDGSTTSNITLNDDRGTFAIIDLSENMNEESTSMILVTDEGDHTSFRGVSTDGIPSSPMPETEGVEWQKIEALDDDEWIATGIMISSNSGQDNNPASPDIKPVIGYVIWTGGFTAPMLVKMDDAPSGEFHSMIRMGDQMIIAGTTQTTIFDSNDLTFEHSTITSSTAIKSDCEVVWFFGPINSDSVIKWTCLLYTSPSPRDATLSRMPSSA